MLRVARGKIQRVDNYVKAIWRDGECTHSQLELFDGRSADSWRDALRALHRIVGDRDADSVVYSVWDYSPVLAVLRKFPRIKGAYEPDEEPKKDVS